MADRWNLIRGNSPAPGDRRSMVRGGSPSPGHFMDRGRSPMSSGRGSAYGSHAGSPAPDEAKFVGAGGINQTIQQLADEQERVQKKTFTNWINSYLLRRDPPCRIEELFEDIKDGTKLLMLLEVLSGEKLAMEKGPRLKRLHFISNISTALSFLESKRIKLVNINSTDVVDGKPAIVLGLVWTIILYFQIEEFTKSLAQQSQHTPMSSTSSLGSHDGATPAKKSRSALDKFKGGAKKMMLGWAQKAVTKRFGIEVKDFGRSWRSGLAFNAMVHNVRPDLIDMNSLAQNPNRVNLENAFDCAEKHLGIPRLLDSEDVDVDKPDEKSIMTYVAQFLEKYPDPDADVTDSGDSKAQQAAKLEQRHYNDLLEWLTQAEETLSIVDLPVNDRQQEYKQYMTFTEELKTKTKMYERLEKHGNDDSFLTLTQEKWTVVRQRWTSVTQQTRIWQWKLDSNLPGQLGYIGDWLYRAEEMVESEIQYVDKHEDTATNIKMKLDELKGFFQDLEQIKKEFHSIKGNSTYEGVVLPRSQISDMNLRFQTLTKKSDTMVRRLEYEEMKYRLLAFLVVAEAKLKAWTVKCGRQDEVEALCKDYMNFVHEQELFKEYDKTYQDCKRRADVHKRQDPQNTVEADRVNKSLDDITEKWRHLKVEISSVQTMLEEVVEYWKRYHACVDLFHVWLGDAEQMLKKPPEERADLSNSDLFERWTMFLKDFFENLDKWEEKLQVLKEASNFLVEAVDEPIAQEVKEQVLFIDRRWHDVQGQVTVYLSKQTTEKSRQEYSVGLETMQNWLRNAEELLKKKPQSTHGEIRKHLTQLDSILAEEEQLEAQFKVVSRTAQSLVKDSDQATIREMLELLKACKQRLVSLQRDVPEKLKPLKSLMAQVESLENGISDLSQWLDSGERLLDSHRIDGNINVVEDRLVAHKDHFKETTYYKSMLESKNKVYQKVSKNGTKHLQISSLEEVMVEINKRFQSCVTSSKDWENRLEKGLRLWRNLQSKAQPLEEWVQEAEVVLAQGGDNINDLIASHRAFFDTVDSQMDSDFTRAGQELLAVLAEEDCEELETSMGVLHDKQKEILEFAPIRLIKLQFQLTEEEFLQNIETAEKTLAQQKQALEQKGNIKEILRKHKVIFQESGLSRTCLQCLEEMATCVHDLQQRQPEHLGLQEAYEDHVRRWENLRLEIEALRVQLEEVPQRWQEYNTKRDAFISWMGTVEETIQRLEEQTLSTNEYKETLDKFQEVIRNIDQHRDDAKWLVHALDELRSTLSDQEAAVQQGQLDPILDRYKRLMPAIEITTTHSTIVVKCHDYKDGVEHHMQWLNEAEEKVREDMPFDDMESVRVMMEEQQTVLERLARERPRLEGELETGRRLLEDESTPEFVQQAVNVLEDTMRETETLANIKYQTLRENLECWEEYEATKAHVNDALRKAESEGNRQSTPGGQDSVQKELDAKRNVQRVMEELEPEVQRLKSLSLALSDMASEKRQANFADDMEVMEERVEKLNCKVNDRVAALSETDQRWTELYGGVDDFGDWLAEKEKQLHEVSQSNATPDEQYRQAKLIAAEIFDNQDKLLHYEEEAAGLSQGHRSRETAAVKSKIAGLKRTWEGLRKMAKQESDSLSGDVSHWNQYQSAKQQLLPWLDHAERYVEEDKGKSGNAREARQQLEQHQGFILERDNFQDVYDHLVSEASHLTEKPGVADEVMRLQHRWGTLISQSEDQDQHLHKANAAWQAFSDQCKAVREKTEQMEDQFIADKPNLHAVRVDDLQSPMSACKALQDEISAKSPDVQAIPKLARQLQPFLNPAGTSDVAEEQANTAAAWDELQAKVQDRHNQLQGVLEERQIFWDNWGSLESLLDRTHKQLDGTAVVYADEVQDVMLKVKALGTQVHDSRPDLEKVGQQVQEMMPYASKPEQEMLKQKYEELQREFDCIEDLSSCREELCQHWSEYKDTSKGALSKIKSLQQKLTAKDLHQDEIDGINEELREVHAHLQSWEDKKPDIDQLMEHSRTTIKNRASQKPLNFEDEVQTLQSSLLKASNLLDAKQDHLNELSSQWLDFESQREDLYKSMTDIREQLDRATISTSSLDGICGFAKNIKVLEAQLDEHCTEVENLRSMSRQLMASDPSNISKAQSVLSSVESGYESLRGSLAEKDSQTLGIVNQWQQLNDTKDSLNLVIAHAEDVLAEQRPKDSQSEIREALDKIKSVELEMNGHQRQLDQMNNRAKQLAQDTKGLPGFDPMKLKTEVDKCNQRWLDSSQKLSKERGALEEQAILWEQISGSCDEVTSWLDVTVNKLEDDADKFADANSVQTTLQKYKEESPYFEEVFETMQRKMAALQDASDGRPLPVLREMQDALNAQFNRASDLSDSVDGKLGDFMSKQQGLQEAMEDEVKKVTAIRDRLSALDDINGDDDLLMARLNETKTLRAELKSHEQNIVALKEKVKEIDAEYKTPESAALQKELANLEKKLKTTVQKSEKLEDNLENIMEQQVEEMRVEQQRWLGTAREKVDWCTDVSGDKYSVEAKLATIDDILNSLPQSQEKAGIAAKKVDQLKSAVRETKREKFDEIKSTDETVWQTFVQDLQEAKSKLDVSIQQWQGYDNLYEDLSKWVKDTEVKVRSVSGLRADLPTKQQQLQMFQNMASDILAHQPGLEKLKEQAKEIEKTSNDSRVPGYVQQLSTRYESLRSNVDDLVEKQQQNVSEHEAYSAAHKQVSSWLLTATEKLASNSDPIGEKEDIENRLEIIQDLMTLKEDSTSSFNAAIEAGEKLYPNTSTNGREIVRQELRSLRDQWEEFSDGLSDANRRLSHAMTQWKSFEESLELLQQWMKESEIGLTSDLELKATLSEKRALLQQYRGLNQEVTAHQTLMDALMDKGQALQTNQATSKTTQLINRYQNLVSTVKDHTGLCETYTRQHQQYTDELCSTQDWLLLLMDRLDVCAEPSSNKHAIQSKLDKVQELLPSIEEGNERIGRVRSLGEKSIPQTATSGQAQIRREIDALFHDWELYAARLTDTHSGLQATKTSWEEFDAMFDMLSKWVRDVETQLQDQELKSTLSDKRAQVDKFKALQQDIASRQSDFDAISIKTKHLEIQESKMASYSDELMNRYKNLRSKTKEAIAQWDGYVHSHEVYDSKYTKSMQWMNNLSRKLSQCGEVSGDRQVIEQAQAKLQDILAEKEQGAPEVHQTIESGEKLYPDTAVEGRELIRQQLRLLREKWEAFSEELSENQRQMEVSLVQLSTYEESVDQFHKWLSETQVKVKVHAEVKATLPEKKAQLHSHKAQHQDIMSHLNVLDSLRDRAQSLHSARSSPRLSRRAGDVGHRYRQLCGASEELLTQLEEHTVEHQVYQDLQQECHEQLNALREKVNSCMDTNGDRFAIQNKAAVLQDVKSQLEECQGKLKQLSGLCDKTLVHTSLAGKEVLKREVSGLLEESRAIETDGEEADERLQAALQQWTEFEDSHTALQGWLQQMEQQMKESDLKSTLDEKQSQASKFRSLEGEITSKRAEFDSFSDIAEALSQTSHDMRLLGYATQAGNRYEALVATQKDLVVKWDGLSSEHQTYREKYNDYTLWLSDAKDQLDQVSRSSSDLSTMEHAKQVIQELLIEKDKGLSKLNAAIQQGEKLYPDTAASGREKIRQQLRTAKDVWDSLLGDMSEMQRRNDTSLSHWGAYTEGVESVSKWTLEVETWLKGDSELKNSLQEKRAQLQNNKALLQDVTSHSRVVDSVIEKAKAVLQHTQCPEVKRYVQETPQKYSSLLAAAKEAIAKSEDVVSTHSKYQDEFQASSDWLKLVKDRLAMCTDITGDKHSVNNKLERVKDLINSKDDGESKIRACENAAAETLVETGNSGKQIIERELESLRHDWDQYTSQLAETQKRLSTVVAHWEQYESSYEQLADWMKVEEKRLKEYSLVSSLKEKQDQVTKYQELNQHIREHQAEVDHFADDGQLLVQTTSEGRVSTYVQQMSTRYQTLLTSAKDLLRKCEQNATEHENFEDVYSEAFKWVKNAQTKFAACTDLSSSRDDLQTKQNSVQELLQTKEAGFVKLSAAIESGEKLYPNTATEGREVLRQQLRRLKQDWDALYDEVMANQRHLEVNLVQWTSFEESYEQVETWMVSLEGQLNTELPLHATLEEKKTQLQAYRSACQDVMSYQRVLDSMLDKAQSLARSSSDPKVTTRMSQVRDRYKTLCAIAKERVEKYEEFARDHQQYNSAATEAIDWLSMMRERLEMCGDSTGDRHAVQNRLDRLERRCDVARVKGEGDPKVTAVVTLSDKVIPNTSTRGQEIVLRDVERIKLDWDDYVDVLMQTKTSLQQCVQQWKEFEESYNHCATWLKEVENQVKAIDLCPSLQQKNERLHKLRNISDDIHSYQADLDEMTDKAQALSRISGDTRVTGQASQLTTRYQTFSLNVKETLRQWEQYAIDHQLYEDQLSNCKEWQKDFNDRLASCTVVEGDKFTLQNKLSKTQELLSCRDDGYGKLQQVIDQAHLVLPNTSAPGKENINEELSDLRQRWDDLTSRLNTGKTQLELATSQWTLYDESSAQLNKWLSEAETSAKQEAGQQASLPDKRSQLEKVKVLTLDVNSHQPLFTALIERAETLSQTTQDPRMATDASHCLARYQTLADNVHDSAKHLEAQVNDHQGFQDACQNARDWINAAQDKLVSCVDVRGDRQTLESKREKIENLLALKPDGQAKIRTASEKASLTLPNTAARGQDAIKSELKSLSDDFETWNASVNETSSHLEKTLHQWTEFDHSFEELSEWLKEIEITVKSVREAKATLHGKQTILDKYKAYYEDVRGKQGAFDALTDRTHFLLQSSTDSRIMAQLTQLNSRYTALGTFTKDTMKKLEQQVDDHQQYEGSHQKCVVWLRTANDRLSACGDTSGDKETIQAQLESLHEFMVLKEEGQALIHAANTWGEKTIGGSSEEGRQTIHRQLLALQTDWEAFLATIAETRAALEACLLQWSDFADTSETLDRWLKDTDRRLRDSEPKADLGEKKAQLQRIKGLQQDILSREHMIESVKSKAQGLSLLGPGAKMTSQSTQIVQRYENLVEKAKDAVSKQTHEVSEHQTFQEAVIAFNTWLSMTREKLAACSDTYGDKSTIVSKLEKAKKLELDLGEGSDLLASAKQSGEKLLPNTAKAGHTRINHDLQILLQDCTEVSHQVTTAESNLQSCLQCWNEFDIAQDRFSLWLTEATKGLKQERELKANLVQKDQVLSQQQSQHEELVSHQADMDDVSRLAQALLEVNSDARVSHAITQLSTRYQALISQSKELVKKLESHCVDHRNYDTAREDFESWLRLVKDKLSAVNDTAGTKDELESRLTKIRELQTSLDYGQGRLRLTTELVDRVLPNTNLGGCQSLEREQGEFKREYEKLKVVITEAKAALEATLADWMSYERSHDQLNLWLKETETRAKADSDLKADLPEKKAQLEKFRMLSNDITQHQAQMKALQTKAQHLAEPAVQSNMDNLQERFDQLKADTDNMTVDLQEQVTKHEEYKDAYRQSMDWVLAKRQQLQQIGDASGSQQEINEKKRLLAEIQAARPDGNLLFDQASALASNIEDHSSSTGKDRVSQEMKILKEEMDALKQSAAEFDHTLNEAAQGLQEFETERADFACWLEAVEQQVVAKTDKFQYAATIEKDNDFEALNEEMANRKPALEKLVAKSEAVLQKANDPGLSSSLIQLSTKYQSLQSTAKETSKRRAEFLREQQVYKDALSAAQLWLKDARETIDQSDDCHGEKDDVVKRMSAVKTLSTGLDEGLHRVNRTGTTGQRLVSLVNVEGQRKIEGEMEEVRTDWDGVNRDLNDVSLKLERQMTRWNEFSEKRGALVAWLDDTETDLRVGTEPKIELMELRSQLEKFRMLSSRIESKEPEFNALDSTVTDLAPQCDRDLKQEYDDLRRRFTKAGQDARSTVLALEQACDSQRLYREALHESEKWILQASYRLMAHNSLDVSSPELTSQQIEKHRALMTEIDDYQTHLSHLRDQANEVISGSQHQPTLAQQIDTQMANLDDSYASLQTTAAQIQGRLEEFRNKWAQYRKLLEQCTLYMESEALPWLQEEGNRSSTLSIQEQARQQNIAKDMLDTLHKYKQEISTAAHKCDNLGQSESSASSSGDSTLRSLASEVGTTLDATSERVEAFLNRLRENQVQWESVDKARNELAAWLTTKKTELAQLESRPAKLHQEAAMLELSHLEEMSKEIESKKMTLEKLTQRYQRLAPNDQELVDKQLGPLNQLWTSLRSQIDEHKSKRQDFLTKCSHYHRCHGDVNSEVDGLLKDVDRAQQSEDLPMQERLIMLQLAQTEPLNSSYSSGLPGLRESATQTRLSVLRGDAARSPRLPASSRSPDLTLPRRRSLSRSPSHNPSNSQTRTGRSPGRAPKKISSRIPVKPGSSVSPIRCDSPSFSQRQSRDDKKKRRQLPQDPKAKKLAASSYSDAESGYGGTLAGASSEYILVSDTSVHTDSGLATATQTPRASNRNVSVSFQEPEGTFAIFGDEPRRRNHDESQENVLQAILEADLAVQRRMALETISTQPAHLNSWYRDSHSPEYYEEPVQVYLDDENVSLTDSAKQKILREAPAQHPDKSRGQVINVIVNDDDTDTLNGTSSLHLDQDTSWMEHNPDQSLEIIEQNVTVTRHLLEPNTAIFSDEECNPHNRHVAIEYDSDESISWHSGVTEPDPISESTSETRESSTQTVRHRRTQTPEDTGTQTNGSRRRRLPILPNGSTEDISDNGSIASSAGFDRRIDILYNEGSVDEAEHLMQRVHLRSPPAKRFSNTSSQPLTYLRDYQDYVEICDNASDGHSRNDTEALYPVPNKDSQSKSAKHRHISHEPRNNNAARNISTGEASHARNNQGTNHSDDLPASRSRRNSPWRNVTVHNPLMNGLKTGDSTPCTNSRVQSWDVLPCDDVQTPRSQQGRRVRRPSRSHRSNRDFSTQTFGQPFARRGDIHAETQTVEFGLIQRVMSPEAPHRDDFTQTLEHEGTQTEEASYMHNDKDIFSKKKKKKKKKDKKSDKKKKNDEVASDANSAQSSSSKKDLLKLMLSQVKNMKKQVAADAVDAPRRKHRHHKHESDSAIDMDDDDRLYNRRRLEQMFRKHRKPRHHSVESYHSDDGERNAPSPAQNSYFPRAREAVPQRRAYTPPGVTQPPDPFYYQYLNQQQTQQNPGQRRLPQVPVQNGHHGYNAPPPQRLPIPGVLRPVSAPIVQQQRPNIVYLPNHPPVEAPRYVLVSPDRHHREPKHSSSSSSSKRAIQKELEKSVMKASKAAEKMRRLTQRIHYNAQL